MRLDRKLKAEAEKAAAEDNRSLAGLIVKLLRDYLAKTKPPKQTGAFTSLLLISARKGRSQPR